MVAYFSSSLPAVTSWEKVAFLALMGSSGSSTASSTNMRCSSPESDTRSTRRSNTRPWLK